MILFMKDVISTIIIFLSTEVFRLVFTVWDDVKHILHYSVDAVETFQNKEKQAWAELGQAQPKFESGTDLSWNLKLKLEYKV